MSDDHPRCCDLCDDGFYHDCILSVLEKLNKDIDRLSGYLNGKKFYDSILDPEIARVTGGQQALMDLRGYIILDWLSK